MRDNDFDYRKLAGLRCYFVDHDKSDFEFSHILLCIAAPPSLANYRLTPKQEVAVRMLWIPDAQESARFSADILGEDIVKWEEANEQQAAREISR